MPWVTIRKIQKASLRKLLFTGMEWEVLLWHQWSKSMKWRWSQTCLRTNLLGTSRRSYTVWLIEISNTEFLLRLIRISSIPVMGQSSIQLSSKFKETQSLIFIWSHIRLLSLLLSLSCTNPFITQLEWLKINLRPLHITYVITTSILLAQLRFLWFACTPTRSALMPKKTSANLAQAFQTIYISYEELFMLSRH